MIRTIRQALAQLGRGLLMVIGYAIGLLFVGLLVLTFLANGPAFMWW